jgi:hypothetical protein
MKKEVFINEDAMTVYRKTDTTNQDIAFYDMYTLFLQDLEEFCKERDIGENKD